MTELSAEEKALTMDRARKHAVDTAGGNAIAPTTKVLAIASERAGSASRPSRSTWSLRSPCVGCTSGSSTPTSRGFSVPRMLGIEGRLDADGTGERPIIKPHSLAFGSGRLDVVSMGFLVEDEESALLWRGLMLNRAVQHFSRGCRLGRRSRPPRHRHATRHRRCRNGSRSDVARAEMIVVTTPATGAQKVAARAVTMARKSYVRVAGIIENMSAFITEDGRSYELFGSGGGAALAASSGAPLIGQVPIEPAVSHGGDAGTPAVLGEGAAASAFHQIAERIVTEVAPPIEMAGCTARLLAAAEAALDELEL
ncbi:MAG: P-loop NTPase [Acidimicrobiales bacterium]